MRGKLFYVFEQECFWLFCFNYSLNIEKQSAASVPESFSMTDYTESLTRKAAG
jgi:hypothetical protein